MIIGIAGLAGAGKSTVARRLIEKHQFVRLPFAGAMKDMLRACGFTDAQVDGNEKEQVLDDFGKSPRQIMQLLGTEFARDMICSDFWVKVWGQRRAAMGEVNLVVDDVRFQNEVDTIQSLGGLVWHIHRPGIEPMGHKSEGAVLEYDRCVLNHATVQDLNLEVDRLAERLAAHVAEQPIAPRSVCAV